MKLALTLFLSVFATVGVCAQGTAQQRHPGIQLYQQGKHTEAIASLEAATRTNEYATNPEIWNYLGLAYHASGNTKKSQQALEKSVKLDSSSAAIQANLAFVLLLNQHTGRARKEAEKALAIDPKNPIALLVLGSADLRDGNLDRAEPTADLLVKTDPRNAQGYLLLSKIHLARFDLVVADGKGSDIETGRLEQAIEALKTGIARASGNLSELEKDLEWISTLREYFSKKTPPASSGATPDSVADVTPLKISHKPPGQYTDAARAGNIQGKIVVKVLFGADGKIVRVFFIQRLGYGLDESVLRAARAIKFEPKKRNGKPVSTLATLEYTFSVR